MPWSNEAAKTQYLGNKSENLKTTMRRVEELKPFISIYRMLFEQQKAE
jgi:hypothetical protein